jgi:DNA-binding response OmpR family regulator
MSGYTDEQMGRRRTLAPDASFLQKPFTPPELARRVRETLDARRR